MLRTSSSTTSTVLPTQVVVGAVQPLEHRAASPAAGRRRTRCRNSAVSSSSRSGDSTPLTTTLRAMRVQPRVLLGRQLLAGEDDDRQRRASASSSRDAARAPRSRTCRAAAGRAPRSRSGCSRSAASASAPVPTVAISMSSWPSSSRMLSCSAALSSTTSSRLRRGAAYVLDARERRLEALGRRRLGDEARTRRARGRAGGPRRASRSAPGCGASPGPASAGSAPSSRACRAGTRRARSRSGWYCARQRRAPRRRASRPAP